MPTYCDKCEDVIVRDEEVTRVEGSDYCLNCVQLTSRERTVTVTYSQLDEIRQALILGQVACHLSERQSVRDDEGKIKGVLDLTSKIWADQIIQWWD